MYISAYLGGGGAGPKVCSGLPALDLLPAPASIGRAVLSIMEGMEEVEKRCLGDWDWKIRVGMGQATACGILSLTSGLDSPGRVSQICAS